MADQIGINTLQNVVTAINLLTQAVQAVFPQGEAVTSSAGAASGKYLTIIAPDGNVYKIALLNPS